MKFPFQFKKLIVPSSTDVRELESVQTWEVRWTSRHGDFSTDIKAEMEVFTSEEDATYFAKALRAAFNLTRITNRDEVKVRKTESQNLTKEIDGLLKTHSR